MHGKDAAMYRRILLTLDGSELARAAIGHATLLAGQCETAIFVLQAIDSQEAFRTRSFADAYEFTAGGTTTVDELAKGRHAVAKADASTEIERAVSQLRAAGVKSVEGEVVDGMAGNAILDAADRHDVDAILMASRGHGGLGREVIGSVAEYVLRHAGTRAVILVGPRARSAGPRRSLESATASLA
jgi:nucleotide-binding universal stress UspA family protein